MSTEEEMRRRAIAEQQALIDKTKQAAADLERLRAQQAATDAQRAQQEAQQRQIAENLRKAQENLNKGKS